MKIFDVILKLIETLGLVPSEEFAILKNDTKDWESTCTVENKDKIKAIYAKIHKGVFVRLFMPFLFYVILGKMKRVMNPEMDERFLD